MKDEQNYPSNSKMPRENPPKNLPEKRVKKSVAKGRIVKKKSDMVKLADIFLASDIESVKKHVIFDVLIPKLKDGFFDIVMDSLSMTLFGSSGKKRSTNASNVDYTNKFKSSNRERLEADRNDSSPSKTRVNYNDIEFDSRDEAEEVLESMYDLLEVYGHVSVLDFFDFADVSCDYTDDKYGWINLDKAQIVPVRGGRYKIKLPRAMVIDRD
mgnify:CR=1 FL=1